jgi:hypothetical protein
LLLHDFDDVHAAIRDLSERGLLESADGKRIDKAKDGNYEWKGQIPSGDASDLYLIHKACSYAFKQVTGDSLQTAELTLLPIRLGNNLEIDWNAADEMSEL